MRSKLSQFVENSFLDEVKNRIKQIGKQYGQKRKIINAYYNMKNALKSSIEHVFYLPQLKIIGDIEDKDLNKISQRLVDLRSSIAHGDFICDIDDVDAQKIRFLEILTYSLLLQRIGLKDCDIERVIGVIFSCNYVVFNERFNSK